MKDKRTPSGLVIIDKDQGWTSHDVVAKMRGLAGTRKVGHAGTLDPMATGVLVVGLQGATRLLTHIVGARKRYTATIRLGQTTLTDDAEGEVTSQPGSAGLSTTALLASVAGLTGNIMQVPSSVSAIKVDGKRAYAKVRGGEEVKLKPRPVTVDAFEVLSHRVATVDSGAGGPVTVWDVDVDVTVSSGTYIRALARDLGAALGTGGHLTALRRHTVGPFSVDRALTMTELAERADAGELPVVSMAEAARLLFSVRELEDAEVDRVRHGQFLDADALDYADAPVAGLGPGGELVALLGAHSSGKIKPVTVFAEDDGA